jgi:hypothetical protein
MTNDTVTTPITPDTDITVVVDAYVASWNEQDPAARAALIAQVWAEDGRNVDPLADAVGHTALDGMVAGLQEQFPGHSLRRTSGVDAHHEVFRFGWEVVAPDGAIFLAGIDAGVRAADGRIQAIAGFFGDLPES